MGLKGEDKGRSVKAASTFHLPTLSSTLAKLFHHQRVNKKWAFLNKLQNTYTSGRRTPTDLIPIS